MEYKKVDATKLGEDIEYPCQYCGRECDSWCEKWERWFINRWHESTIKLAKTRVRIEREKIRI
jgi:hypothetical protein